MKTPELLTQLAALGTMLKRLPGDRLEAIGRLTPTLRHGLVDNKVELLKLYPDPCERIVSGAIDQANALCPPSWVPTDQQWEAMDEFQQRMYDAARAGDVEWTKSAAADYVRVCGTSFLADSIHEWKPGAEVHWRIGESIAQTQPRPDAVCRQSRLEWESAKTYVSDDVSGHVSDTIHVPLRD